MSSSLSRVNVEASVNEALFPTLHCLIHENLPPIVCPPPVGSNKKKTQKHAAL